MRKAKVRKQERKKKHLANVKINQKKREARRLANLLKVPVGD